MTFLPGPHTFTTLQAKQRGDASADEPPENGLLGLTDGWRGAGVGKGLSRSTYTHNVTTSLANVCALTYVPNPMHPKSSHSSVNIVLPYLDIKHSMSIIMYNVADTRISDIT